VGAQKNRMLIGIRKVRTGLMVLCRNKDSIGKWIRAHSCYILTKNWFTFCPCPETLRRLTLKVMD
jgi:hypothetical protein